MNPIELTITEQHLDKALEVFRKEHGAPSSCCAVYQAMVEKFPESEPSVGFTRIHAYIGDVAGRYGLLRRQVYCSEATQITNKFTAAGIDEAGLRAILPMTLTFVSDES